MKKVCIVLLAFVMAFGLAACGGGGSGDAGDEGNAGEDTLWVGLIYIGPATDGGFTQAHDNGRAAMEGYFGGAVRTMVMENVPESTQDVKAAAQNMIDNGCEVIIANSYGFMDAMEELAEEYPDLYFLHFSGYKMNDTNFDNFFGAMEEPRYLSGMVAGLMTETNKLGYVAAFPYTEVQIGINAFALGAQSVNPDVEVNVIYINTWYDPADEKAAAEALLAQGCDVIAQHCDTTGPTLAAEAVGAYAIGYNLDNQHVAPETFLTAPVWNHGAYYISAVQAILDGTFTPTSYYGSMADGYVDISPFSDVVPADVRAEVERVKVEIMSGAFAPFSGKIDYADGRVLSEEGQTLGRGEIWEINDVVKGVNAVSM